VGPHDVTSVDPTPWREDPWNRFWGGRTGNETTAPKSRTAAAERRFEGLLGRSKSRRQRADTRSGAESGKPPPGEVGRAKASERFDEWGPGASLRSAWTIFGLLAGSDAPGREP